MDIKKLSEQLNESLSSTSAFTEAAKRIAEDSSLQKMVKSIESLHLPDLKALNIPEMRQPKVNPALFKVASHREQNDYQSAGVLMKSLASSITEWRKQLPENVQPAVMALLNGGVQIDVSSLAQESFHGIRVEGKVNGVPCIVLAHQSTLQLLCYVQPINPPETPKRRIGFIIDGEQSEV